MDGVNALFFWKTMMYFEFECFIDAWDLGITI